MRAKEQAINALETMKPADLLRVYNLILSIKNSTERLHPKPQVNAYLKVRESLKNYKGSLANDITLDRNQIPHYRNS